PAMARDDLIRRVLRYQTDIHENKFNYTNMGFTAGCLGAARAQGKPDWEQFSQEAMRKPGMKPSPYLFTSALDAQAGTRAAPHRAKYDLLSREPSGWEWYVNQEEERNPTRQAPAGALLSNATELATFLSAHLQKRFAPYPLRELMDEEWQHNYCLGWNV